jgi:hypothetical protein
VSAADRWAICDLIARYAVVVDRGEFDALDELFTPDAVIDFTAFGGPAGPLPEIKAFLRAALSGFQVTQHLMGLPLIDIDGDRATARTGCSNPMIPPGSGPQTPVWLIGLWYDDEFVRTDAGWRFSSRRQQRCYSVLDLADTPLGPA